MAACLAATACPVVRVLMAAAWLAGPVCPMTAGRLVMAACSAVAGWRAVPACKVTAC
jgi:hypothetical protein